MIGVARRNAILWCGAVVLLTILGYFLFPGHTYLQSDTQIYVPMMEHLRDPSLFSRDIMAVRPHLGFTVYDETALALRRATRLDFEAILTIEQLIFRALGVWGAILLALSCGLKSIEAFFVAAVVSLGATIAAPAVLTIEYEPVPRGFAIGLILFALGLSAQKQFLAAGIAGSIAFLYHPPTSLPFWMIAAVLVLMGRARWTLIAPLVIASALLLVLARAQAVGVEPASLLRKLDPFQESLQRMRASYSFVSAWTQQQYVDFGIQTVIGALAFWRIRKSLATPLREFLWGLPVFGLLSIPLSWILLERGHWALIPEWQPARAMLFVTLCATLLAVIAAMKAEQFAERLGWLTAAFLASMQHSMLGKPIHWRPLALAMGLALIAAACAVVSGTVRGPLLAMAGVIPFFLIPQSKLVENYPRIETQELRSLARWARSSTPKTALFLFPDAGRDLDPGIFRARSLRGLYVDWKSGGQVNYFPEFSREWWSRWQEISRGNWTPAMADFPKLAGKGIDYVVLKKSHAIVSRAPVFVNDGYVVYSTTWGDLFARAHFLSRCDLSLQCLALML